MRIIYLLMLLTLTLVISCTNDKKNKPLSYEDQVAFHQSNFSNYSKYNFSKNDIQRSAVFNDCNAERKAIAIKGGYYFVSWVGVVSRISTNQGGDNVDLEVKSNLNNSVDSLKSFYITYRNDVLFNSIDKESPVYNELAQLVEGDMVEFAAKFIDDSDRGIEENSLTELGCISEPEFTVEFISIRKLTIDK